MSRPEKLGRNAPCWCGSGVKFKKCHLGRVEEQPLLPIDLLRFIRQDFAVKRCLHPEAASGVCTRIIDAHTVQRANTLQALIDPSNHVLSFYPFTYDSSGLLELKKIGWRRASTFTGFCGYHDSYTFAPVEQGPFKFTPETAFLLAYRALCHELFQKMGSERARIHHQPLIDRGYPPDIQREIQHQHAVSLAGVRKAIADLMEIKQIADNDLVARNYAAWEFACLTFTGSLCIATSGAATPNLDLHGAALQILHDPNSQLEYLFISVIADQESPRVILGWRAGEKSPQKFVGSLLATPGPLIPAYLLQYVFAHLENVYFSDAWWRL